MATIEWNVFVASFVLPQGVVSDQVKSALREVGDSVEYLLAPTNLSSFDSRSEGKVYWSERDMIQEQKAGEPVGGAVLGSQNNKYVIFNTRN